VIIVKVPLRVSFVGGGTDLPEFTEVTGLSGQVISTTINRYVYVMVNKRFDNTNRVSWANHTEIVNSISECSHNLVKDAHRCFTIPDNLEIVTIADMPGQGTGLGSSSATTVGLLNAFTAYNGFGIVDSYYKFQMAELAFEIERKYSKLGRQDQYAAMFGGLRKYTFEDEDNEDRVFSIHDVYKHEDKAAVTLLSHCLFFWAGPSDKTVEILEDQSSNIECAKEMLPLVDKFHRCLQDLEISGCGPIIRDAWEIKKQFSPKVTTYGIECIIDTMYYQGATGCKVLGSGGGGIIMAFVPLEKQNRFIEVINDLYSNNVFLRDSSIDARFLHFQYDTYGARRIEGEINNG
jgi:D-glycero-alpha-D-manno-heptose-7-phosphate kinase